MDFKHWVDEPPAGSYVEALSLIALASLYPDHDEAYRLLQDNLEPLRKDIGVRNLLHHQYRYLHNEGIKNFDDLEILEINLRLKEASDHHEMGPTETQQNGDDASAPTWDNIIRVIEDKLPNEPADGTVPDISIFNN